jgi:hypothetical protein
MKSLGHDIKAAELLILNYRGYGILAVIPCF